MQLARPPLVVALATLALAGSLLLRHPPAAEEPPVAPAASVAPATPAR